MHSDKYDTYHILSTTIHFNKGKYIILVFKRRLGPLLTITLWYSSCRNASHVDGRCILGN